MFFLLLNTICKGDFFQHLTKTQPLILTLLKSKSYLFFILKEDNGIQVAVESLALAKTSIIFGWNFSTVENLSNKPHLKHIIYRETDECDHFQCTLLYMQHAFISVRMQVNPNTLL